MKAVVVAVACAGLVGCASVRDANAADTSPPAPCSAPEFGQMDFWVGEWDLHWDASASIPEGRGTNVITRELDNCVIVENFTGDASTGNLVGRSLSTYAATPQRWRQTWVDNQGGYFALVGGPEAADRFVLVSNRLRDNTPVQRMVFENITHDALTWRWQSTADGGATWTDSWVIEYRRRAP